MRHLGLSEKFLGLSLLALSGCTAVLGPDESEAGVPGADGSGDGDGMGVGDDTDGDECDEGLAAAGLRRITAYEAAPLLADLLGIPAPAYDELPPDAASSRGYFNTAAVQVLHPSDVESLVATAERLSEAAVSPTALPPQFSHCTDADFAACVQTALPTFLRQAFRRPVAPDESAPLGELFVSEGANRDALRLVVQATLLMPRTWFIARNNHTDPAGVPNAHDIAERLALLLWNSAPDLTLQALADSGDLVQADVLEAQVARLLTDARSERFVGQFADQWLGLGALEAIDTTMQARFAGQPAGIVDQMRAQAVEFVRHIARSDQPIAELLLSTSLPMNAELSEMLSPGVPLSTSTTLEMVPVPAPRAGLLGVPALLTLTADDTRTSVVQRGITFSEHFACQELEPPPAAVLADIAAFTETPNGLPLSAFEASELRLSTPSCAGCHQVIDPMGISLEIFDNLGRYRTTYADGSAVFQGTMVAETAIPDVTAGASTLAASDEFARCVLDNVGTFLAEQDLALAHSGACAFEEAASTVSPDTSFRSMIAGFVSDPDFLKL